MPAEATSPTSCPIDPAARDAWLQKAQRTGERPPHPLPELPPQSTTSTSQSIFSFQFPAPYDAQVRAAQAKSSPVKKLRSLSQDREISTIPRADINFKTTTPNPASKPSNHEQETGADTTTGNWIYPSEKMFFDAMRRKNYDPQATDMVTIVPIHNAVNERAWKEIKDWESRFSWSRTTNEKCGGPRLHSFSGDSQNLSPRARWKSFWGYTKPFDRHDWIIERCPGQPSVEYVIDFYEGRSRSGKDQGKLNFYLDVRPKLNSLEGWRMRLARISGLW